MPRTPFSDEQARVLASLAKLWSDRPWCLIGANALACHLEQHWRVTRDIDISVAVGLKALVTRLGGLAGFRRDPHLECRWIGPGSVKLDVLPASRALLVAGEVVWPETGTHMNLLGFRLALEKRRPFHVTEDLSVDVAPLAVVGLLKMVSYLDRPREREHDLADLAYILEEYLPPVDDRRFASEVYDARLDYHQASAYAFGRDLGGLLNGAERAAVEAFLERVRDERDPTSTQARMARLGPRAWHGEPELLLSRIEAFDRGLLPRRRRLREPPSPLKPRDRRRR